MTGTRAGPIGRIAAAAAGVFAVLAALQLGGWFEPLDRIAYDRGLRWRAATARVEDRIALVELREEDLAAWGWPLSDDRLAALLAAVVAAGPRAVGVDIYRDRPVAPGSDRLDDLLRRRSDIVWVDTFPQAGAPAIAAPAVMADSGRVGFADIVADDDGVVRRALLYMTGEDRRPRPSFALTLALAYLAPAGIAPRPAPDDPSRFALGAAVIPPLAADDGAYVGADDRGYQFLLDYALGAKPFATFTAGQVMAGAVPAAALAGRLVFVGVAAHSVKDQFLVPLGAGGERPLLQGLVLHAQAAGQLLRLALDGAPYLRVLPGWAELGLLAAVALVGAGAGALLRGPVGFALLAGGGATVLAGGWLALLAAQLWVPLAALLLALPLAAAVAAAALSRAERAERDLVMRLFTSHLSAPVAQAVWRQRDAFMAGGRPRPQRLPATILFSDIEDFTPISETLGPDALMAWLEDYVEAMVAVVGEHGGVVLRFLGDGILAAFGVPVPRASSAAVAGDAASAIACALAMERALLGLNARWRAAGLPAAAVRVGIETGPVLAGSVGGTGHLEYSVMGDTVNTAARLEALGKTLGARSADSPCLILVGAATWAAAGEAFEGRPLGEIALKGKRHEVAVWQVSGRRPVAAGRAAE